MTSRIGTAKNLQTGGSYDLLMVKFEGTYPEGKISFGLHDTPMKITGLQKVAQTFMKILLTTKGSDPFYPHEGTVFSEMTIGANQTVNDQLYTQTISDAIQSAGEQTKTYMNTQNADLSSCLANVELLGMEKFEDGLTLFIGIQTMNGVNAQIALPFPQFGLDKV